MARWGGCPTTDHGPASRHAESKRVGLGTAQQRTSDNDQDHGPVALVTAGTAWALHDNGQLTTDYGQGGNANASSAPAAHAVCGTDRRGDRRARGTGTGDSPGSPRGAGPGLGAGPPPA